MQSSLVKQAQQRLGSWCSYKKIFIIVGAFLLLQVMLLFVLYFKQRKEAIETPIVTPVVVAATPLFAAIQLPPVSFMENRTQPDTTALALVTIDVNDAALQCRELEQTVASVLQSTWKWTRVTILQATFKKTYWKNCVAYLQEKYLPVRLISYFARNEQLPARFGAHIEDVLQKQRPGYFFMMQVGDTVDATFVEKAIWSFTSRANRVGYVNTYWQIGDAKIYPSPNTDPSVLLDYYATNPGSLYRTDAVLAARAFNTSYPRDGCNDWEVNWRLHLAGWTVYTMHEFMFFKHLVNVHSVNITLMRCTMTSHSDTFIQYLRYSYPLNRHNFNAETNPDYSHNFKRQMVNFKWDPIEVAGPPGSILSSKNEQFKKRSIMVLIPWLTAGGAETFALNVIRIFSQRGWHVTVVMTSDSGVTGNVWEPVAKQDTKDTFTLLRILHKSLYPQFLCHLIRSRGIEAIIMTNSGVAYLSLAFINAYCPVGAIIDVNHNWIDSSYDGGFASFSLDFQQFIDYHLQISNILTNKMLAEGASAAKLKTVYIGTNTTYYTSQRSQYDTRAECLREFVPQEVLAKHANQLLVIVYLGRLTEDKQPDVFVNAMVYLKKQGYGRKIFGVVAGTGEMEREVKKLIDDNRAQDVVQLVGSLGDEPKRKLLSCSDALIMTSKTEGTPLSIFEAMAIGNVIIAPKIGGIPEMVTNREGILIDIPKGTPKDKQAIHYAKTILQVYKLERKKLAELKSNAQQRAKMFDFMVLGKTLEGLIDEAQGKNAKEKQWTRINKWQTWPNKQRKFSPIIGATRFALLHGEFS